MDKEYRIPLIERIVIPTNRKWTEFDLRVQIHLPSFVSKKGYDGFVIEQFKIHVIRKLNDVYGPHRSYIYTAEILTNDATPFVIRGSAERTIQLTINDVTKWHLIGKYLRSRIEGLYGDYLIESTWQEWNIPEVQTVIPAK